MRERSAREISLPAPGRRYVQSCEHFSDGAHVRREGHILRNVDDATHEPQRSARGITRAHTQTRRTRSTTQEKRQEREREQGRRSSREPCARVERKKHGGEEPGNRTAKTNRTSQGQGARAVILSSCLCYLSLSQQPPALPYPNSFLPLSISSLKLPRSLGPVS